MALLTSGELARKAGVNVQTLRYYERRGLLLSPARSESGYRQYPPDVVRRIRFIQRAKELGFTLVEIAELLALQVDGDDSCDEVREQAEAKLEDVTERIYSLQRMQSVLRELVDACHNRSPTEECPILQSLQQE